MSQNVYQDISQKKKIICMNYFSNDLQNKIKRYSISWKLFKFDF